MNYDGLECGDNVEIIRGKFEGKKSKIEQVTPRGLYGLFVSGLYIYFEDVDLIKLKVKNKQNGKLL